VTPARREAPTQMARWTQRAKKEFDDARKQLIKSASDPSKSAQGVIVIAFTWPPGSDNLMLFVSQRLRLFRVTHTHTHTQSTHTHTHTDTHTHTHSHTHTHTHTCGTHTTNSIPCQK